MAVSAMLWFSPAGAIRCKARRHRWHLRQPWHCGTCKLQNLKEAPEFESHSLRQFSLIPACFPTKFHALSPSKGWVRETQAASRDTLRRLLESGIGDFQPCVTRARHMRRGESLPVYALARVQICRSSRACHRRGDASPSRSIALFCRCFSGIDCSASRSSSAKAVHLFGRENTFRASDVALFAHG